jgi:thymidylate synthase ThyX
MYEAKIIKDSICNGHRLTTMQLTHPRIVHAEFNTHCMFARNASSSRAIPFSKVLQRVIDDPFIPKHWGVNQSGMQAAENLEGDNREAAIRYWLRARDQAIEIAKTMADKDGLNVHKQIVNRLLEPWSWITVCVTGDSGAWSNYFALRCEKDAQPDIQEQAYMAQYAYFTSIPQELNSGDWHTPYVSDDEKKQCGDTVIQVSVGRCARTSYLTQEGVRDFSEDIKLHDRLRYHTPLHASPFEHVCMAMGNDLRYAKYTGWQAYRNSLPREYVTDFVPNHSELVQKIGCCK